jgi:hypothetical protein
MLGALNARFYCRVNISSLVLLSFNLYSSANVDSRLFFPSYIFALNLPADLRPVTLLDCEEIFVDNDGVPVFVKTGTCKKRRKIGV